MKHLDRNKYRMDSMNILSFNFEMSICFSQVTRIILSFEKKKRKENAFDYLQDSLCLILCCLSINANCPKQNQQLRFHLHPTGKDILDPATNIWHNTTHIWVPAGQILGHQHHIGEPSSNICLAKVLRSETTAKSMSF